MLTPYIDGEVHVRRPIWKGVGLIRSGAALSAGVPSPQLFLDIEAIIRDSNLFSVQCRDTT